MESEARYTAVGAVLVILVLAVAAAVVWLTHSSARAEFRHYTIYFERQSLEGLQVGGHVEMRGVEVGRVERFSISRDNINRVQVTIRIDDKTPVSSNTVAVVARNILTGLAHITLVTQGAPGPELTEVAPGEQYPVVAEGESDLQQLAGAINRLAVTGTSALANVDQLLQENREAVGTTLASLHKMSDAVAKSAVDLGQSSRDIAAAAERVAASGQPVASQAEATLRDLSRAATALERGADVSVNEFRATAQELRASAEVVARTAERLDDPRRLLLGPSRAQLGPGEELR
jgi:phospholipid/cholesterol/gamma-HCH transport system substrate-binding protein